jgi:hypothetical protein
MFVPDPGTEFFSPTGSRAKKAPDPRSESATLKVGTVTLMLARLIFVATFLLLPVPNFFSYLQYPDERIRSRLHVPSYCKPET